MLSSFNPPPPRVRVIKWAEWMPPSCDGDAGPTFAGGAFPEAMETPPGDAPAKAWVLGMRSCLKIGSAPYMSGLLLGGTPLKGVCFSWFPLKSTKQGIPQGIPRTKTNRKRLAMLSPEESGRMIFRGCFPKREGSLEHVELH